jgi:uncharacterized integral membrane protein
MSFQDDPTNPKMRREVRHGAASGSSGPSPKLIGFVVLFVVIAVFIIANDKPVEVSFAVFTWETTVRWAIFIAVLLGIALDRLFSYGMRRRGENKLRAKQLKDDLDE